MKSFQFVVAALLLVSSAVTLADKPDPELPNPPLQVWIAGGEVIDADVIVQNEVEIKNDDGSSIPVDVGEPTVHVGSMPAALEPEPITASRDYTINTGVGATAWVYTVPADKRLVIEFVTANMVLGDPENRLQEAFIQTLYSGDTDGIKYSAPPMTLFLVDDVTYFERAVYRGSQQVTIYADPDKLVSFGFSSNLGCVDGCTFNVTISGYLIPVD